MEYRDLLNRCKSQPGWLGTREQKNTDDMVKYGEWLIRQNEKKDDDVKKNEN